MYASFVDFGGAYCAWGPPNTDFVSVFAESKITSAQASVEKAKLTALGFTGTATSDGEVWEPTDPSDGLDGPVISDSGFLFAGSTWKYCDSVEGWRFFAQ